MSENVNTRLLEEAAFFIDYFCDTTIGLVLELDVERNDLEMLAQHVAEARNTAHQMEFNPDAVCA